jgi:hypothetical protein
VIKRFEGRGLDPSEQKVISHVEGHGWSVTNIEERSDSVGWSFTVVLFENYKHPEVIIFGMSHDSRHRILNWIGDNVKSGKAFTAGVEHDWVLDGFNCWSRDVQKKWYRDLLGWAIWFYEGVEFPSVQCIWPAKNGAYPWDLKQVLGAQPLLYESDVLAARMLHYVDDQVLTAQEWPFESDPHERVFVSRCVVEDGEPVVLVVHDAGGDWEFMGPVDDPDADGCKISCFHCVVERDSTLRKLARLQLGWRAWRKAPSDEWIVEKDSTENQSSVSS